MIQSLFAAGDAVVKHMHKRHRQRHCKRRHGMLHKQGGQND
jgi:hypothetical protein